MSLEVRVLGARELRRVAEQIRREGRKDLSRQLGRALSQAADPVKRAIRESADHTMPRRGGYQAVLGKSLRHRMARRSGSNSASVTLTTFAEGKGERRDVNALEAGRLRHPVFGRFGVSKHGVRTVHSWSTTSIRAGFHKRGTDGALDEAARQMVDVVQDLARRLAT